MIKKMITALTQIRFYVSKDQLLSSELATIKSDQIYYGEIDRAGRYLFAEANINQTFHVNSFPNIGFAIKEIFNDLRKRNGLERCDVIESIDYFPSDNSRLTSRLCGGETNIDEVIGGENLVKEIQSFLDYFILNGDVYLSFKFDISGENRHYSTDWDKSEKTLRLSGRNKFITTQTVWSLDRFGTIQTR